MTDDVISLRDWYAGGAYADCAGHRIFYRQAQQQAGATGRRVLVCVHGYPTSSWDWAKLWPALLTHFDAVVAPDMPGFGYSAKPRGHRYRIAEQCDVHEALLAQLGYDNVLVLAHDYGDTVAQEWLARHNDGAARVRLRGVAFLNGGLFPETHRARRVQKLLASPLGPALAQLMRRATFDRTFRAIFGAQTPPSRDELDGFWHLATRDGGKAALARLIGYMAERRQHRDRWVGALQASPVPLRVIDGVDDPVSGGHMVDRYEALVPDPDTVRLAGLGHYPQVEAPERVLAAFLPWADEVAA
ncbi:MAG: alpha/beta hydrolase, partial [Oceanococcaceae bacterium]